MRRLLDTVPDTPPLSSDGAKPGDAGGAADAYFTTSVPVVLAALLCALVCALGLGSILRCAIRCARPRLALETPEATAATGLEKKALRQIPTMVYGPGATVTATECPICLGEFGDGEQVRVLPKCHHGFHVDLPTLAARPMWGPRPEMGQWRRGSVTMATLYFLRTA
ncbi:hypothetical protein GW17_00055307 [Ensete ventricosum]|nr:hypothetical protein GW17_00055307 [Ensete ventricosum]